VTRSLVLVTLAGPTAAQEKNRNFLFILTDEQRPILQKLTWDMVSKYPYAGIAKFEESRPSKEGEKTAPKLGVGANALP